MEIFLRKEALTSLYSRDFKILSDFDVHSLLPCVFPFLRNLGIFRVIFNSGVMLNLFANSIYLLILEVGDVWVEGRFVSLRFERVF